MPPKINSKKDRAPTFSDPNQVLEGTSAAKTTGESERSASIQLLLRNNADKRPSIIDLDKELDRLNKPKLTDGEVREILMSNGVKERRIDVGNISTFYLEAGSHNEETMVLIHGGGNGGSYRSWKYQILDLAERYRVIAPDFPGYGMTEKHENKSTLRYLKGFIGLFMDALQLDRVDMMSSSMGAGIAIGFALDNPSRIDKFIAIGSYGISDKPMPLSVRMILASPKLGGALIRAFASNDALVERVLRALGGTNGLEIVDNYGVEIRNAMAAAGISSAALAKALNFPEENLKMIEQGEMKPDKNIAKKLEKKLGIKLMTKKSGPSEKFVKMTEAYLERDQFTQAFLEFLHDEMSASPKSILLDMLKQRTEHRTIRRNLKTNYIGRLSELNRSNIKILLAHGDYDPIFPVEAAKAAASKLEHCELHEFKCMHGPHLEVPEEFNKVLFEFLAKNSDNKEEVKTGLKDILREMTNKFKRSS